MKMISAILMLLDARDQNNLQDNLGVIISSISYIITRSSSSTCLPAHNILHKQSGHTPYHLPPSNTFCSKNIFTVKTGRLWQDRLGHFSFHLSRKDVDIIQWKLFIIQTGTPGDFRAQTDKFSPLSVARRSPGIYFGFDVGLALQL